MPGPYPFTLSGFDGAKFKARYNLVTEDFMAREGFIHLRAGLVLPDDPPIFEAPDPPGPKLTFLINNLGDYSGLLGRQKLKEILLLLAKRLGE